MTKTSVIKMNKIVLLIPVVCFIFGGLNGYPNVYNESKCVTAGKNETSRLHCQEHEHIHIEKIWTDEDKCIFGQSANVLHTIRNISCSSKSSCDVKHVTKTANKYLNIIYKCANCLPLKSNTTSEIACRTNMVFEIYDVWITQVHGYCPGYKQTHKNHTFNSYVPMKRTFSKRCNWKSRCEIYNSNLLRTASVYYQCRDGEDSLDLENGTSRQGGVIAGVAIGILLILCILVAVFIVRRWTVHNKNKKTYEQSEVPQGHQNGNHNIGISNSAYTDLVSSIEYSYDILSAEPDSSAEHSEVSNKHQNGNQDNGISNLTYIELVSSIEYSYEIPRRAEPDSVAEKCEVPKEHQNGNKNNAMSNSPYEMASSMAYLYAMTSAEPDSIAKQREVPNEHQNGDNNNAMSNSPYEMASSIAYLYAMTSAEPDSIAKQSEVPNEHQNGDNNNAMSNSPYEMASSIKYSYAMTSAELDFIAELSDVPKVHQNGSKNNAMSNSPYEMASSIEYSYSMTSAEPASISVKNTGGSNEHLHVKGNRTTGKPLFNIESSISSTYSHLRDADADSDIAYDITSHTRVQRSPEGDYNVSCNRVTEDEYNISENYNVSYHKTSDYN